MIFYFSGTGNSRWVATQLAERLNDKVVNISEAMNSGNCRFALDQDERVGWVFPIHSWGPAPIVIDFINKMHLDGYDLQRTYCYMVCTCGDDIGRTVDVWLKALGRIVGNAAFSVQMPNNYILLPGFDVDSDEVAQKKIDNAPARFDDIVARINVNWNGEDVERGGWSYLKTKAIYPLYRKWAMSDKPFKVEISKCTSCGKCWKSCPVNNIVATSAKMPLWQHHCEMCLACIHVCPTQAIQYSNQSASKGRYQITKYLK